jgi:hypothetical protein
MGSAGELVEGVSKIGQEGTVGERASRSPETETNANEGVFLFGRLEKPPASSQGSVEKAVESD